MGKFLWRRFYPTGRFRPSAFDSPFRLSALQRYPTFTQSGFRNYPASIASQNFSGESAYENAARPSRLKRRKPWRVGLQGKKNKDESQENTNRPDLGDGFEVAVKQRSCAKAGR